jgi:hypothetical protein
MNRTLVAAVLLAVLAILGGLDLLEDTGLIHYSTTEMDRTVEDALDNYGEAIRSPEIVLATAANLNPRALGSHQANSRDRVCRNVGYLLRHKRSLDFAGSAFTPLKYSQVFVV